MKPFIWIQELFYLHSEYIHLQQISHFVQQGIHILFLGKCPIIGKQ